MKMVINGYAGAGTITMGGFDYHDGTRATGEMRNFRAGRCIGACLEYAARKDKPLMIYVFSDGSLTRNGMIDNSADGRGKVGGGRQPVDRGVVLPGLTTRPGGRLLDGADAAGGAASRSATTAPTARSRPPRTRAPTR